MKLTENCPFKIIITFNSIFRKVKRLWIKNKPKLSTKKKQLITIYISTLHSLLMGTGIIYLVFVKRY